MANDREIEYTLTEFCEITRLSADAVRELVGAGIIEPRQRRNYWVFSTQHINRCARAERLMHDLELTPHGAALALELMEQNRRLQRRISYLEQLLGRLSG